MVWQFTQFNEINSYILQKAPTPIPCFYVKFHGRKTVKPFKQRGCSAHENEKAPPVPEPSPHRPMLPRQLPPLSERYMSGFFLLETDPPHPKTAAILIEDDSRHKPTIMGNIQLIRDYFFIKEPRPPILSCALWNFSQPIQIVSKASDPSVRYSSLSSSVSASFSPRLSFLPL